MGAANGQVMFNDSPSKTKLVKFCEKKIEQWVRSQLGVSPDQPLEASSLPEFNVSFSEESDQKQISCVTEVRLGGHTYRGYDLDCDTQQAFIHSLKRMQAHAH